MKSFKMEIELVVDACAADAWAMAQSRLADVGRVTMVVDADEGEFVKPISVKPTITHLVAKER